MSSARKPLVIWILFEGYVMRLNYASQLSIGIMNHESTFVSGSRNEPISETCRRPGLLPLRTHANSSVIKQQETPDLQYEKSSCFFVPLDGPEFGHNKTVKREQRDRATLRKGKKASNSFGRDVETHILRNTSSTTSKDQQLCVFQANLRVCRWKLCKRALCYVHTWRFSRTSRANVPTTHTSFLQVMCWSVFRTLGALKMTVDAGC